MADHGWWQVLGVERSEAASWHRLSFSKRIANLRRAFKNAVHRLDDIEEWTVVPLLNAYSTGLKELTE